MSDFMCSNGCGNDVEYASCSACETKATEATYKRGFDAGVEFQKKADPPPKAKQYRDALAAVVERAHELLADESEPCGFCATENHVHLHCGSGCFEALQAKSLKAQKLAGALARAEGLLR